MTRGRKPKPTALKELQGNPGKRAINAREPKPTGTPRCPQWLKGEARKEWQRVTKGLAEIGIVTKVDRAVLAAYCQSYARWVEAEEHLELSEEEGGSPVIENTKGNLVQNPWIGVAQRAKADMLKFASELGMTPSARTRLKVKEVEKPKTLAEQLFSVIQETNDA